MHLWFHSSCLYYRNCCLPISSLCIRYLRGHSCTVVLLLHKVNHHYSSRLIDHRHTIWLSRRAGTLSCDHRPPGCQGQPTASLSHSCTAAQMMKSSPRPPPVQPGHYSRRRSNTKKEHVNLVIEDCKWWPPNLKVRCVRCFLSQLWLKSPAEYNVFVPRKC